MPINPPAPPPPTSTKIRSAAKKNEGEIEVFILGVALSFLVGVTGLPGLGILFGFAWIVCMLVEKIAGVK